MIMKKRRSLCRDKKGMATIFGALFFVILLLMGFNLFIWVFVNYDNYNRVIANMQQRDQAAIGENLVPQNPGAQNFTSNTFNIVVNNLGIAVSVARIYIVNLSPTGSSQCLPATPCIVDPNPNSPGFSSGNVQAGEINHLIKVTTGGVLAPINDGSGYKVILSSTRGRDYTFYYPWPVTITNTNPSGNFVTNIGPLAIYFDFKSFNFTQGSQTSSQSAFCVPSGSAIVFWVKISNTATDSSVKLKSQTMMQMQPYTANGFGQFVRIWIDDPATVNPGNVVAYNEASNPYVLPAAAPSGPAGYTIVKFSASGQNGGGAGSMGRDDNWITFIGFYYIYRGQTQGQTIPFMDFRSTGGYPGTC